MHERETAENKTVDKGIPLSQLFRTFPEVSRSNFWLSDCSLFRDKCPGVIKLVVFVLIEVSLLATGSAGEVEKDGGAQKCKGDQ